VTDGEDVHVAELGAALRAAQGSLVESGGVPWRACFPVRALDRPGNDVLEAAERGAALAGRLIDAEALVQLDPGPAPGALRYR
jgi:hypothetical protein